MTDTNRQNEIILKREEEKVLRNQAKVEALEENMTKTLADLLKNDDVRKSLGQEIIRAASNPNYSDPFAIKFRNDEVITGNEEKVWEKD